MKAFYLLWQLWLLKTDCGRNRLDPFPSRNSKLPPILPVGFQFPGNSRFWNAVWWGILLVSGQRRIFPFRDYRQLIQYWPNHSLHMKAISVCKFRFFIREILPRSLMKFRIWSRGLRVAKAASCKTFNLSVILVFPEMYWLVLGTSLKFPGIVR